MIQEITHLSRQFYKLKKKYEMSHRTQCFVAQECLKQEYECLKIKLKSLEQLSITNDITTKNLFIKTHQTARVLGLYLMV